jgi:hypothetical protein
MLIYEEVWRFISRVHLLHPQHPSSVQLSIFTFSELTTKNLTAATETPQKMRDPKIIKVAIDEQAKFKAKDLSQICPQNSDVPLHCALYSTDIPVL